MIETVSVEKIHCAEGKLLIEITEVLGGTTKGGVFIPGTLMDHGGKDTAYGRIVKVGPPPRIKHESRHGRYTKLFVPNKGGATWCDSIMGNFRPGNVVFFARDVPKVFQDQGRRYAIVLMEDCLLSVDEDEFDSTKIEILPSFVPGQSP